EGARVEPARGASDRGDRLVDVGGGRGGPHRRGRWVVAGASAADAPREAGRRRASLRGPRRGRAAPAARARSAARAGRARRLASVKILTVVGNRPQFIKAAAVSGPLRERHEEILVHTGQHHDDSLSRVFFTELGLARPDRELAIGGGTNREQTARML